jgi:hypothetical protein
MKKILMLILANDGGKNNIYTILQNIMRKYIHTKPNIEAYFYKADPNIHDEYVISGDTIYVKTVETYPNLWKKFWLVLKAFENRLHEFAYITRPNLSTFIILDRYLKHIEMLPKTRCCSGIKFFGGQPIPFPSGYLFTITPDLAKEFIYNDVIKDNQGIDDRCIGIILKHLDIDIRQHNDYIEINNTSAQFDSCMNNIVNNENIFMIRIRNLFNYGCSEHPFGIDSENRLVEDLKIHLSLLQKIYDVNESITFE